MNFPTKLLCPDCWCAYDIKCDCDDYIASCRLCRKSHYLDLQERWNHVAREAIIKPCTKCDGYRVPEKFAESAKYTCIRCLDKFYISHVEYDEIVAKAKRHADADLEIGRRYRFL